MKQTRIIELVWDQRTNNILGMFEDDPGIFNGYESIVRDLIFPATRLPVHPIRSTGTQDDCTEAIMAAR